MKTLIPLTLAVLAIFTFPNVSEAGKGNIPIAPFQIAQGIQSIAQAIQSAKEPIHNSKPVATPASKRTRTASRSSRRSSLAAASSQSSAVGSSIPAELSQAAGWSSAQFAGLPSSTTVSGPRTVAALPTSAAASTSPVNNVNQSPTQAASIAAASTPAASSNAAATATTAFESAQAATPPPSAITWKEVNAIYNLQSNYTDLQKDEAWKRYKGQRVKWVGKVEEIKEGWLGGLSLMVMMNRSTLTFDLMIDLKDEQKAAAMSIHKGAIIEFTGTLDQWGSVLPITVQDGEIISGGGK